MIEFIPDEMRDAYLLTARGSGVGRTGPFVALIPDYDATYRYKREFLGHRVGVGLASIEIRCTIPRQDWTRKPQLLEIRGEPEERGFYVLHGSNQKIALSPIEEPTLIELLDARKLLTVIPEEYLPAQRTADTLAELRARIQSRAPLLPPAPPPMETWQESAMRRQQEIAQMLSSAFALPAPPNRHQRRAKAKQQEKAKAPVLKLGQVRKINFDDQD